MTTPGVHLHPPVSAAQMQPRDVNYEMSTVISLITALASLTFLPWQGAVVVGGATFLLTRLIIWCREECSSHFRNTSSFFRNWNWNLNPRDPDVIFVRDRRPPTTVYVETPSRRIHEPPVFPRYVPEVTPLPRPVRPGFVFPSQRSAFEGSNRAPVGGGHELPLRGSIPSGNRAAVGGGHEVPLQRRPEAPAGNRVAVGRGHNL